MLEHFFQCPYCGEGISMLLDPSVPEQTYLEDCEICCNPLQIHVKFQHRELLAFDVEHNG